MAERDASLPSGAAEDPALARVRARLLERIAAEPGPPAPAPAQPGGTVEGTPEPARDERQLPAGAAADRSAR